MADAAKPFVPTLPPALEPPAQWVPPPAVLEPARSRLRPSAISPAFGFALGVAGLVTATVAYYQLAQFLSGGRAPS